MLKRTLLFAALLTVSIFFMLIFLCHVDFRRRMPDFSSAVLLSGKLHKLEEKTGGVYLYLSHAKGEENGIEHAYGRVILFVKENVYQSAGLKIGNRICAKCVEEGFDHARNFGNFDEEAYYASLGISGKFELQKGASLTISDVSYDAVRQFLLETRTKISHIFGSLLDSDPGKAGIFSAIVTGDRSDVTGEIRELYQKNGIAHILAVSGLHISLIGMGIFRLLRKGFSLPLSGILSAFLMLLFCIMSGGSPSAIRATILFLVRMLAMILGKTFDMLSGISFSAICLLLSNPNYLRNTAFLLSFGAVTGIAVCAKGAETYLEAEHTLTRSFLASLSVFLATAPILMAAYYELNLYSILLNLAVIPLMSMILGSGILCGLSGLLSIALARLAIGSGVFLLSFVEILCGICDALPYCVLVTGAPGVIRCILFYALLLAGSLFVIRRKKRKKPVREKRKIKRAALFVGGVILLLLVLLVRLPEHTLKISFLDVDQGDGILLQMPDGSVCMIDGGSATCRTVGKSRMESAIKYLGIDMIDYAFVSHADTDHISGLMELLTDESAGHIRIRNLFLPKQPDDENTEALILAAKQAGVPVTYLYAGMSFSFEAVTITCLHPSAGFRADSVNGYSAVLSLQYRDFSALFTGDLEETEEKLLLTQLSSGYDLLKVAHHGSRTSSSAAFLERILDPYEEPLAVVSAGVQNVYGHPHQEVLDRLSAAGFDILCTKDCGEICVEIHENGEMQVKTKL